MKNSYYSRNNQSAKNKASASEKRLVLWNPQELVNKRGPKASKPINTKERNHRYSGDNFSYSNNEVHP